MFINDIKDSFEKSGFEMSLVSYNEKIEYYKYRCRYEVSKNNYLVVILNNNKIMNDENFLSIRYNSKFLLRNRSFRSIEDINKLLVQSIIKLKELDIIDGYEEQVIKDEYELVNNNYCLVK